MFCAFYSTNLTLRIRTKDLHSIVRSRRPVVVPIECPLTQNHGPTCPPKLKVQEPPLLSVVRPEGKSKGIGTPGAL